MNVLKEPFTPSMNTEQTESSETSAPKIQTLGYHPKERIYEFDLVSVWRGIILHVVLYGCETWSLKLREERRLRVFENRVLRREFGPKRDEVTGEWRKLHNDLFSLPNIVQVVKSRRMR